MVGQSNQVRIVYSNEDQRSFRLKGKVFAVIGPFDGFNDKRDLQRDLENLLRRYNRGVCDTAVVTEEVDDWDRNVSRIAHLPENPSK